VREKVITSNTINGGVKMDKHKIELPDFNELTDRIIAEPTSSPTLVIKTNLDQENNENENPYATNRNSSTRFKNFFKD
jgi:hypothetical protein